MAATRYRFDSFELDVPKRRLLRAGEVIPLGPKAFEMLRVLVEHNGDLLTKDDLFRLVWEGQFVEEANLTVNMSAIRKALGENPRAPRYITTVSGRGYYFTGDVESVESGNGQILQQRTHSRVVVSEETEFDDESGEVPKLTAARSIRFVSLALLAAAIPIAGVIVWYVLSQRSSSLPFERISIRRLTSTGRITTAGLSPDGKLFAYSEQEKDGRSGLWLEHVDGGGRVNLLEPADRNVVNMTFTRDGSQLYYSISTSDVEKIGLYRIPAFGGAPEFLKEGVSRVSFDGEGKRYAYVKWDPAARSSSIQLVDVASGSESTIAERSSAFGFVASTIDWSRDSGRIAVAAIADEQTREQEILLIELPGDGIRQLTSARWNGIRAIAWLPDGRSLIATAGEQDVGWEAQLWHVDSESGKTDQLVADLNTYGIVLSISSDGEELLTAQGQFYSNIWIGPAEDLESARQVTFDMLGRQNGWDGLDWTPDGKILFTSYVDKSETIWSLDPTDNSTHQIIPNGRRNILVSISDDGSAMAFESNRSGSNEIWVAAGDGSDPHQVTTGGGNFQPHISSDGSKVLYQNVREGGSSLWIVPTAGGQSNQIIARRASWGQFSRDGKYIAAAIADTGRIRLGTFSAETGDLLRVFDFPPQANPRLGIHWTPDGNAVTYRDWGYGIWSQSITGGTPERIKGLPEEKLYGYAWSKDGKQFAFARGREIRDIVLITKSK